MKLQYILLAFVLLAGCNKKYSCDAPFEIHSMDFPQGGNGESVKFAVNNTGEYTVPDCKNLYITSCGNSGGVCLAVDGIGYVNDGGCPMFPPGTEITRSNKSWMGYTGILIDVNCQLDLVYFSLNGNLITYTVPEGKTLYLKSGAGQISSLTVDDVQYPTNHGSWIFDGGTVLGNTESTMYPGPEGYTGYLLNAE